MEIKRLWVLVTKIFKTINDINSSYMKNIFVFKANAKVRPSHIEVRYQKSFSYDDENLNILGPKIWNHHPSNIQSETKFEEYIITWFEPKCKCSLFRMIDFSHDFSYCYLFFYVFIIYFSHNVEFYCVFLLGICSFYTVFTFHFGNFWFSDLRELIKISLTHSPTVRCQMSFNLDQFTG